LTLKPNQQLSTCIVHLSWVPPANVPPPANGQPTLHPAIGLYVVRNQGPSQQLLRISPESITARSHFSSSGDVYCDFKIEHKAGTLMDYLLSPKEMEEFPSHYTIIPMTYEPKQFGSYRLSCHTGTEVNLVKLTSKERWSMQSLNGEWKGANAGGCRNNATFNNNPKYLLTTNIRQVATVIVRQVPTQAPAPHNLQAIGVYVLSSGGDVVAKAPFLVTKEIFCTVEYVKHKGPYTIVPCTFEPGKNAEFSIQCSAPASFTFVTKD